MARDDTSAQRKHVELLAHFDTWTFDELLFAVDNACEAIELARAILRAGLGAPVRFEERFFVRIKQAAENPEPVVREMALWAMVYPGWSQFRPVLKQVVEQDPVEAIREQAEEILIAFDAQGVPEE